MLSRLVIASVAVGVALAALLGDIAGAQAGVVIVVNKSSQRLSVSVDGTPRYEWPVSTARQGYNTPNGTYGVERMEVSWFSRRYDWSPMPHSIFFDGGYAIHGSYEIGRLGTPASHGCIRLHPHNATTLFNLVRENRGSTRIVITGGGGAFGLFTSSVQPPRSGRSTARRGAYYDDDYVRPPRSIRGSRARNRSHDFEEIFN
jgi:hypothetical protein